MQGNTGEYRGMPEECMGVGAKCQRNAGECWVMQAYAKGMYRSGCKAREEFRLMQGNAGECQGNVW